ncbi:6-phosphogluconolactonase [Verrucomicrobia bacterium LW23]|nr:6-phosphogluconolactonase [Verrucomicrobia bacterium LW23]
MDIQELVFPHSKAWLTAMVADFNIIVRSAIAERGAAHVALSGGNTPKAFYEALNGIDSLPWEQIGWWLGDERTVPVTNDSSNEKMVRATLGKNRPEFDANFISWHLAPDYVSCAEWFGEQLVDKLGTPPTFDLVLLGMGGDGHTASLFPGTTALNVRDKFAVLTDVPQLDTRRFTVTYPVLDAAREIWFLVQGDDKRPMLDRLLSRDATIPSACINNPNQRVYFAKSVPITGAATA